MKIIRYASKFYPLLFFQLLFWSQMVTAQDTRWLDTTYVTVVVKQKLLNELASILKGQCAPHTVNSGDGGDGKRYDMDIRHKTMRYVLEEYFEKKGVRWEPFETGVAIWKGDPSETVEHTKAGKNSTSAAPKQRPIQGWVTDLRGESLPGATVLIKGTRLGTTTDHSGHFKLNAGDTMVTLVFSFMGFEMVELRASAAKAVRVSLAEAANDLEESCVEGYLSVSRRFATSVISSIKASDLDRYPVGNIAGMLQGRVTGVSIRPSNGAPGASYQLESRGKNSLANKTDPLIIIDEVPFAPNNRPLNHFNSIVAQNAGGGISSLTGIYTGNIASIQFLKDAAATAIYGSRGANGVMLIKTKTDTLNGFRVSADIASGFGKLTYSYQLLSTPDYVKLRREGFRNDSIEPNNTPGMEGYAEDVIDTITNTNWQKVLIGHTATSLDGNLNISLGAGATRARIDLGYHKESTPFSHDMRYINSSLYSWVQTTMADGRIGLKSSFYLSGDENKSYDGSLRSLFMRPNAWRYNPNGTLHWDDVSEVSQNPGADLLKLYSIRTNHILYNLVTSISLSQRISLRLNMGYSGTFVSEHQILPIAAQPPASSGQVTGSASFGTNRFESFIAEPMAEYATRNLQLLIGGSCQYAPYRGISYTGKGYKEDELLSSAESAAFYTDSSDVGSVYKYGSVFGQLNYRLLDRYLINFTYRMDGSSRFSPEHRLGHFPAVGTAWIFSEEPFMKQFKRILEYGKLMASHGVTGNDQIGDYQYLDTWEPSNGIPFQGITGFSPESLYNPEYSWERCRKSDISLDLRFLKGRWWFKSNYYLNRSDQQLIEFELPAQTGFDRVLKNFGAVIENQGWELSLGGNIFESQDLQISTDINFTKPRNRLVKFDNLNNTPYSTSLLIGKPVRALNLFEYMGVDPQTGVSLLRDIDGDSTITDNDRVYKGHLDPEFYGGVSLVIKWKKLEVSFLVEYKKQTVPSYTYNALMGDLLLGMPVNHLSITGDHWIKEGDIAAYPKASTRRTSAVHANRYQVAASDHAYTDGSFIKLRNAYIAYTFTCPWLSERGIQSIKGFAKGQNLFTITRYTAGDPETASLYGLPMMLKVEIGIQVNFKNLVNQSNQ